jgi:dihydrofolate reductase
MGKIVAVEYLTLDGVMGEPQWSGPYFNDEVAAFQYANLMEADVMLLGRVTYQGFAEAWPAMEEATGDFGVKMNSMPKHVATTSLTTPEWNATFIEGDVAAFVETLKATDDSVLINGSAQLFAYLAARGLIDEYRFMIYPVVVGEGKKLWPEGQPSVALTLTKSVITESGVAILTYVPAA